MKMLGEKENLFNFASLIINIYREIKYHEKENPLPAVYVGSDAFTGFCPQIDL